MGEEEIVDSKSYKHPTSQDAYAAARRAIVNNAHRRKQKSLDLSNYGLESLPGEIGLLEDLTSLDISQNCLEALPKEFSRLQNLETLDISDNNFIEIPNILFEMTKLYSLEASSNRIYIINPQVRNETLKILGLSHNNIEAFPWTMGNILGLSYLDISNNLLDRFPDFVLSLYDLCFLLCSNNRFNMIPSLFEGLQKLSWLDLASNKFEYFPIPVFNLNRLSFLDLSDNKIGSIPARISNLSSLEQMDMDGNNLIDLPIELTQLKKLKILRLSRNDIKLIPSEFGNLKSIEEIYLESNYIETLPVELAGLPLLRTLALQGNKNLADPIPSLIKDGEPTATKSVISWLGSNADARNENEARRAPIPEQGYGPHFDINENGIIDFVPPQDLDAEGNNIARLKKLHTPLISVSQDTLEALQKGNIPHAATLDRALKYHNIISKSLKSIDFTLLYYEGVRLQNALRAANDNADLPPLSIVAQESINSLLRLHGAFLLSSIEGMELVAAEERFQRSPQEDILYRRTTVDFAQSLVGRSDLVTQDAAEFLLEATASIGSKAAPEKSAAIATGALKNFAIAAISGAAVAAIPVAAAALKSPEIGMAAFITTLIGGEGLKKSKPFAAVAELVTMFINGMAEGDFHDRLRDVSKKFRPQLVFVQRAELQLRAISEQRPEFEWIPSAINWLKDQIKKNPSELQ